VYIDIQIYRLAGRRTVGRSAHWRLEGSKTAEKREEHSRRTRVAQLKKQSNAAEGEEEEEEGRRTVGRSANLATTWCRVLGLRFGV